MRSISGLMKARRVRARSSVAAREQQRQVRRGVELHHARPEQLRQQPQDVVLRRRIVTLAFQQQLPQVLDGRLAVQRPANA